MGILAETFSRIEKKMGVGEYAKGRADMYEILRPYMDTAIKNARLLDAENEGKPPADAAPGTKVFELIEKLKPYLTD
ncbi:MAG: RloB family protein [Lachnospiraceae bacterium]|nr:RloB family protein [Lachnospiraceae bacterium]